MIAQAVCTADVPHTPHTVATANLQDCVGIPMSNPWSIHAQDVWPAIPTGPRHTPMLRGSAWRLTFVGGLAHAGLLAASEIQSSELQETQQTATDSCHLLRPWKTSS